MIDIVEDSILYTSDSERHHNIRIIRTPVEEKKMADQHPNVVTYVRLIQAFNDGDMETVSQCMSADIIYRIPGKTKYAGDYVGIEAFGQMLDDLKTSTGGTMNHTPLHILADDNAVMVYSHVTGMHKDRHLDMDVAYLFRFDDDGRIYEGRSIPVDLYLFDEFWM